MLTISRSSQSMYNVKVNGVLVGSLRHWPATGRWSTSATLATFTSKAAAAKALVAAAAL